MSNHTLPDDNIQNTEDPMPESVKNFVALQAFLEIGGEDEDEKEKRK